jgi:CspA family cold shock protein
MDKVLCAIIPSSVYIELDETDIFKETSTGEEYFVHVSGLVDDIQENDSVEFEAEQGKKGINAVQVRLIR